MRRRNDANIDAAHLAAADADDRPILQHAEQLDLHVEAHVADFVEEERAALARLEMADPARGGPGERAFFMARSEEHTSELQSLMRISYAVFCLKKKTTTTTKKRETSASY